MASTHMQMWPLIMHVCVCVCMCGFGVALCIIMLRYICVWWHIMYMCIICTKYVSLMLVCVHACMSALVCAHAQVTTYTIHNYA